MQNLSAQSISSNSIVVGSPQIKELDVNMIENLWASVDYTTMSQSWKSPVSPVSFGSTPPGFNAMFDMGEAEMAGFDTRRDHPTGSQLGGQSPYPNLMFDGMSPITSFFGGSSMNFGG